MPTLIRAEYLTNGVLVESVLHKVSFSIVLLHLIFSCKNCSRNLFLPEV